MQEKFENRDFESKLFYEISKSTNEYLSMKRV